MKCVLPIILFGFLALPAFAATGPQIDLVNNKLSVDAQSVPLAWLLRLLDQATGMNSKVPADLANRNISVKFSGLSLNDGVRKIFQGQSFDYLVIEGQGVIVTAASQNITDMDTVPVYTPAPGQEQTQFPQQPVLLEGVSGQPGVVGQPQTIQTPFGPQPAQRPGFPQNQNAPFATPGQNNSLFSNSLQSNTVQPVAPNGRPSSPFSSPSPFGSPANSPSQPQNNGMFGTTNMFPANQH